MGLNTGLILQTKTPNQLLGVIAHEAGHIKNRHTLRDGAQNAGMQPMIMTMALGALAAIAGAPVTEWRLYDTAYTERYLGDPGADPAAYDHCSLLPLAAGLQRPLLLIHGLADDNVGQPK